MVLINQVCGQRTHVHQHTHSRHVLLALYWYHVNYRGGVDKLLDYLENNERKKKNSFAKYTYINIVIAGILERAVNLPLNISQILLKANEIIWIIR